MVGLVAVHPSFSTHIFHHALEGVPANWLDGETYGLLGSAGVAARGRKVEIVPFKGRWWNACKVCVQEGNMAPFTQLWAGILPYNLVFMSQMLQSPTVVLRTIFHVPPVVNSSHKLGQLQISVLLSSSQAKVLAIQEENGTKQKPWGRRLRVHQHSTAFLLPLR